MQEVTLMNQKKIKLTQEQTREKEFTDVFETYYKRIYNYIYYRINSHHTAEDLTSLVFEKVMLKIDTYSAEKSPFEVWVFAIARNVLNDYFRSFERQKFFSLDTIKELLSVKKNPEEIMLDLDSKDELLQALDILDKRERNIVALKFGAELQNKEIATLLGLSESNVGVIIYRSMKKLKIEIEKRDRHE